MMQNNFKIAVSDIDGTLAVIGEPVSSENLDAIQALQNHGLEFVLASGRHHENMLPFCAQVPGVHWVISVQGAMIATQDMSEILHCEFMPRDQVEMIAKAGKARGMTILVYTRDGVVSPDEGTWVDYYEHIARNKVSRFDYERVMSLDAFKVVWVSESENIVEVAREAPLFDGLTGLQTHEHLYEYMPSSVSKGNAVERLSKHLGLSIDQVLTMGDGNNDVSMLEIAGCSIAMGHGAPLAIQSAKIVTDADIPATALSQGIRSFLQGGYVQD